MIREYLRIKDKYFHVQKDRVIVVCPGHIFQIKSIIVFKSGTEVEFISKESFEDRFSNEVIELMS